MFVREKQTEFAFNPLQQLTCFAALLKEAIVFSLILWCLQTQVDAEIIMGWQDTSCKLNASWLTWLRRSCRLLCDQRPGRFSSSSTWRRRRSCRSAAPGWAGSPGSPLEPGREAQFLVSAWQALHGKSRLHNQHTPLTLPIVCLEFRPMMGSVTSPMSLPLSRKEEERRQAVPTWPGCTSPWMTCSLRSSWKQIGKWWWTLKMK